MKARRVMAHRPSQTGTRLRNQHQPTRIRQRDQAPPRAGEGKNRRVMHTQDTVSFFEAFVSPFIVSVGCGALTMAALGKLNRCGGPESHSWMSIPTFLAPCPLLLTASATKPRGPAITVRSIARIEDDSKSKVEEGKERIRGKAPAHKVHTIVTAHDRVYT